MSIIANKENVNSNNFTDEMKTIAWGKSLNLCFILRAKTNFCIRKQNRKKTIKVCNPTNQKWSSFSLRMTT
jgi:hypothetical protein